MCMSTDRTSVLTRRAFGKRYNDFYRVTRVLTRVLKSAGAVRFLNPHEVGYLERKDVHMFRRENGSYYNNISSQKVDASVTLDPSALGAHCSSDQCGDKNVVIKPRRHVQ